MHIKKKYLYYIFIAIFGFLISLNLLQNYTYGDQISYRAFYDHVAGLGFLDSIQASFDILTASEPVSILILWTGSNLGVQKDIWISFLNILLILGLFALLIRHKVPWHVGMLIFGNFYFLVLITAAERLKISYIMLVYAFLVGSNIKKFLFLYLALFSHFQTIIFLAGLMFISLSEQKLKSNKKFKINKIFLIIMFLSSIVFILVEFKLTPSIYNKFYHYRTLFSITNLLKISILLIIATIASQNKFRMILSMLPMLIIAALIGDDRVNIAAFSLALGILMFEQRLGHPLVLLLLLYFFVKSFKFIDNIYKYGDGFYIL